eukprot:scaffold5033_cov93-Skeletonema_marinoi.AAC.9
MGEGLRCFWCGGYFHPLCGHVLTPGEGCTHEGVRITTDDYPNDYYLEENNNGQLDLCFRCATQMSNAKRIGSHDGPLSDTASSPSVASEEADQAAILASFGVGEGGGGGVLDITNEATSDDGIMTFSDDEDSAVTALAVNGDDNHDDDVDDDDDFKTAHEITEQLFVFSLKFLKEVFEEEGQPKGKEYLVKTVRYAQMLKILKRMNRDGKRKTMRSIYYLLGTYFGHDYQHLRRWVIKIAKDIGLTLTQLGVVPDPSRGKIIGSKGFALVFDGKNKIDFSHTPGDVVRNIPNFMMSLHKMPQDRDENDPDPENGDDLDPENETERPVSTVERFGDFKPTFIITFEKKDQMETLINEGILGEEESFVLLCSEGNVTHNYLACAKSLHNLYPDATFVHGGDVNPFGVEIMARHFHMTSTAYLYSVPTHWALPLPGDIYGDDKAAIRHAMAGSASAFSQYDSRAYDRVKDSQFIQQLPARLEQLQMIGEAGVGYEMNSFSL